MSKFHWFSFHCHISFYDVCVERMHAKLDADVEHLLSIHQLKCLSSKNAKM